MRNRLSFLLFATLFAAETSLAGALDGQIIDLSYSYNETTVYWPTAPGFKLTIDAKGETEGGYHYEANSFSTAEHGGTHLDAPIHFAENRHATDEIPLQRLLGDGALIDVTPQAMANRDYLVSIEDLVNWEQTHNTSLDDHIVLLRTGFGQYWPDRKTYMGTDETGPDAVAKLHFPGLDPTAALWLVKHRNIKALGLDTPSIDYGQSVSFQTHRTLFSANIPAFENVANLDKLPAIGFQIIALPMKITAGSGGPLRIIAILPSD